MIAALTRPSSFATINIEHSFARLATQDPVPDYRRIQAASIERARKLALNHPRQLYLVFWHADSLIKANRLPDALELIENTLAKVAAAPVDQPAYDDIDQYLQWLENARSRALVYLGRWDDALIAITRARELEGETDISQAVTLAGFHYYMGQPEKALEALKPVTRTTSDVLLSREDIRACIYHQLGDTERLAKSLDYLNTHAKDGLFPHHFALSCLGDAEQLAHAIIADLHDPDHRRDTLLQLQHYEETGENTAIGTAMDTIWEAMAARDDIKATIEKYGVIRSWPGLSPQH